MESWRAGFAVSPWGFKLGLCHAVNVGELLQLSECPHLGNGDNDRMDKSLKSLLRIV